jgi:hypothetical protein
LFGGVGQVDQEFSVSSADVGPGGVGRKARVTAAGNRVSRGLRLFGSACVKLAVYLQCRVLTKQEEKYVASGSTGTEPRFKGCQNKNNVTKQNTKKLLDQAQIFISVVSSFGGRRGSFVLLLASLGKT